MQNSNTRPLLAKRALVALPLGLLASLLLLGSTSYTSEPGTNKPVPGTVQHFPPWVAIMVLVAAVWISSPRIGNWLGVSVSRALTGIVHGVRAGAYTIGFVVCAVLLLAWIAGAVAAVAAALSSHQALDWVGAAVWIGVPILVMASGDDPLYGAKFALWNGRQLDRMNRGLPQDPNDRMPRP